MKKTLNPATNLNKYLFTSLSSLFPMLHRYLKLLLLFVAVVEASCSDYMNVFVDQEGYLPESPKFVFTTQSADSFYVIDDSDMIYFRAPLKLWKYNDSSTGLTIYRGDFSNFCNEGVYLIKVSSGDTSESFRIGDDVYQDLYRKSLKSFYFQRCGIKLQTEYAGKYYREKCHITDAFFHSSTDTSGFKYTVGGWHDAGDYGKYVVNAGITVGTLLMGYEQFSDYFYQDNLEIPESGNEIPDILDEVKYELDWLLKMQNPDGGVYHKLTPERFSGFVMPSEDNLTRYIYEISSAATADFVAVMAQASRIYGDFDETTSYSYLQAAERAWSFLELYPEIVPPNGFSNPDGTETGVYGDANDQDERLWAAVELFLTTGKSKYHSYYTEFCGMNNLSLGPMSWQNVESLAHLEYMLSKREGVSETIRSRIFDSLINYCNELINMRDESGFHVLLFPGEYFWGSNSHVLNKAVLLILSYIETNNESYLEVALDQLHYILGVNAHNMSFVTGVGKKMPLHPHHRPSSSDGIEEPIPGLLVGGANQYLQDPTLQAHFDTSTPPGLCYIDNEGSWSSNEIAINWNAPLVFVSAYFNGYGCQNSVNSPHILLPDEIKIFQNYPNPFNKQTIVEFSLPYKQTVKFKVFDINGKRVFEEKINGEVSGNNVIRWDGRNNNGQVLCSGIYLYCVEGEQISNIKKMVFLK